MYMHPAVLLRMIIAHLMENFQISAWKHVPLLIKIASLIIAHFAKKDRGISPLSKILSCGIQHILDEDTIAPRRVVHQNVGHRPYQLAVLQDGAAAHERLSLWTTCYEPKSYPLLLFHHDNGNGK